MLQQVLGVEAVWCDTRSEDSSQQFVLWAGAVLESRERFEAALQGRRFAFSLLAHSDHSSPMLDFLASSSVLQARGGPAGAAAGCLAGCLQRLQSRPAHAAVRPRSPPPLPPPRPPPPGCPQVRCDCPPQHLLDFLCSSAGLIANEAAVQVAEGREEEEALLEAVREALGAKHVIRVCSSYEQVRPLAPGLCGACAGCGCQGLVWEAGTRALRPAHPRRQARTPLRALLTAPPPAALPRPPCCPQDKVLSAARRLLECAPAIRAAGVNLEGASLAIDDCYELWDSGGLPPLGC